MTAPALGVVLWEREPAALRAKAARAEELGFASVAVGDHLMADGIAPLTSCAIIVSAAERVRVGPLVLNNDLRHPVVLAREAAMLAQLSGGRFELGLGAGYARRQYERAGIPFSSRPVPAARLAESAAILRGLLAGETVELAGEHYVLLGTAAEIAAQLREHHERFGITRWVVFGDRPGLAPAEELVPVLELLGG